MQTPTRLETSVINASTSAPQLSTLRPHRAPCTDTHPQTRALELVRNTYLDFLLSGKNDGRLSRAHLFDQAAQALDRFDIEIEETIARLCAQSRAQNTQTSQTPQARLDQDALQAFGEVIEKRKWGEAHIGLHWDGPTEPFRTPEMPSERIITDRHILQSLEGVFRKKLLRALTFVLFPGDATPQERVFAQAPQIGEALARIPRAHAQWRHELCQAVLGPINHANRTLAEREASDNADTLPQILMLDPEALAERLDSMDACSEDALSFSCARALESGHPEHMGIPLERWLALSQHLDGRARHLREAKPSLRDIAAAFEHRASLTADAAALCALKLGPPLAAKLQRSVATSMLMGYAGQAAIEDATARLMRLDSAPSLARHIENSTAFSQRLARVFPTLVAVLNTLLPALQKKGLRLDRHPSDLGRIAEGAIVDAIASSKTPALASAQCQQLLNDCRNTLYAHRDEWRDCPAHLLLQHLRQVGASLLPTLQSIEAGLESLGVEGPPKLLATLTCGALSHTPTAREWARRAFACLCSAPNELEALNARWLTPDFKLKQPVLAQLSTMRRKGPSSHATLANIMEPFSNRLRDQASRQAAEADKVKTPARDSDEALLEAAIAQANAERSAAEQHGSADATPGGSPQGGIEILERTIREFLAQMPRTVSEQRQLDALTRYFHNTNTEDLLDLTLNLVNRAQYIAYTGRATPYTEQSPTAEKWLGMVMAALKSMDEVSTRRITAGEIRQCLTEYALEFDKGHPASAEAANKIANRIILSTPRLHEMVISMKNTGATQTEVKENALRAASEVFEQYKTYEKRLNAMPHIGSELFKAWTALLDTQIGHFDDDVPLTESIFSPEASERYAQKADETMQKMFQSHPAKIDQALKDQEALTYLKLLASSAERDLRTGFMASPGLIALHHLTLKLLQVTELPSQV